MASNAYMQGRKKYQRPQAMLWADNSGTILNGYHVPLGNEVGAKGNFQEPGEFILLSDDNREPIDFKVDRIEKRERMINGRMRSYHVADKLTISTSWSMLPSRATDLAPMFEDLTDQTTPIGKTSLLKTQQHTTDGGAGGVELLDWYENHPGSFFVYLAYDKYSMFGKDDAAYGNLAKYNQVVEVFFSDFSYKVNKRGNYDFWDISVTLEEV